MILYASQRSPFARKVRIAARELGLMEDIREEFVTIKMGEIHPEVGAANPLAQIPTLVLPDGACFYDSLVICEYLDLRAGRNQLFPMESSTRLEAMRRHAIGHTTIERLVRLMSERMRAGPGVGDQFMATLEAKVALALSQLEKEASRWGGRALDIGDVSVVSALAYADFRFPDLAWAAHRPALASWFASASSRPAVSETSFVP